MSIQRRKEPLIRREWKVDYEPSTRRFVVSASKQKRMVIGDIALNFCISRLSLQSGRILPDRAEPTKTGVKFPLRLKAIGSGCNIKMKRTSGHLTATSVDSAILLTYENTIKEPHFSPDEAVSFTVTELPGVQGSVFYQNRSN